MATIDSATFIEDDPEPRERMEVHGYFAQLPWSRPYQWRADGGWMDLGEMRWVKLVPRFTPPEQTIRALRGGWGMVTESRLLGVHASVVHRIRGLVDDSFFHTRISTWEIARGRWTTPVLR